MTTLNDLLVEHYGTMRRRAGYLTKNRERAEEITQTACVNVLASGVDANTITSPKAWLCSFVFSVHRKARAEYARRPAMVEVDPTEACLAIDGAQEAGADLAIALAKIGAMSPRKQSIMTLTMLGYQQVEIAEMIGGVRQGINNHIKDIRKTLSAEPRRRDLSPHHH